MWLWRRLPHPDNLVPGGPEIDFGIQTMDVLVLGEAKWRSAVGAAQGIKKDKNQIVLRREFCEKYGEKIYPRCRHFVVLGLSLYGGVTTDADTYLAMLLLTSGTQLGVIVPDRSTPLESRIAGLLQMEVINDTYILKFPINRHHVIVILYF
jgi:hypothetical protein